jgi:DNA-binding MarR family transcriptional regulator
MDTSRSGSVDREAHLAELQHPAPRGERPAVLAARSHMTRQAMNQLIRSLETMGYLERRAAPGETTRRVWLTPLGERAVATIRRTIEALEDDWVSRVGEQRFAELKQTLRQLQ